jgi:hypothetical protein
MDSEPSSKNVHTLSPSSSPVRSNKSKRLRSESRAEHQRRTQREEQEIAEHQRRMQLEQQNVTTVSSDDEEGMAEGGNGVDAEPDGEPAPDGVVEDGDEAVPLTPGPAGTPTSAPSAPVKKSGCPVCDGEETCLCHYKSNPDANPSKYNRKPKGKDHTAPKHAKAMKMAAVQRGWATGLTTRTAEAKAEATAAENAVAATLAKNAHAAVCRGAREAHQAPHPAQKIVVVKHDGRACLGSQKCGAVSPFFIYF